MEQSAIQLELARDGFAILNGVFTRDETRLIADSLGDAFLRRQNDSESLRDRSGAVLGGRNVLDLFPEARTLWRVPRLLELLRETLGSRAGLVRALYFDKPPERTWALPWHKDLTIAVESHRPSAVFCKPTVKAGVPHVEAPRELLENMLTLRIHLDDMTAANGPLQVVPGSHRSLELNPLEPATIRTITLRGGDVFVMRPLLTHCSIPSAPGSGLHRRTLHLEFTASPALPDGFRWRQFLAV